MELVESPWFVGKVELIMLHMAIFSGTDQSYFGCKDFGIGMLSMNLFVYEL